MAGELIILPVRVGVGAARFAIRAGMRMTGEALELIGGALKSASGDGTGTAGTWSAAPEREGQAPPPPQPMPRKPRPRQPTPSEALPSEPPPSEPPPSGPLPTEPPPRAQQATAPVPPPPAPPAAAPAHVSEEPELVEEVAEPGAEDGAGAEVTVAEPWDGYRKMKARDVIDRLAATSATELAAVQLYENAHRRRDTVMTAVRRELRIRSGSGAPAADKLRKE